MNVSKVTPRYSFMFNDDRPVNRQLVGRDAKIITATPNTCHEYWTMRNNASKDHKPSILAASIYWTTDSEGYRDFHSDGDELYAITTSTIDTANIRVGDLIDVGNKRLVVKFVDDGTVVSDAVPVAKMCE